MDKDNISTVKEYYTIANTTVGIRDNRKKPSMDNVYFKWTYMDTDLDRYRTLEEAQENAKDEGYEHYRIFKVSVVEETTPPDVTALKQAFLDKQLETA